MDVLHRCIRYFCPCGDHDEIAVKQESLVLDESVSLAHKSARTAADDGSADLFARGKPQAVERTVTWVSLDKAVVLAVGKSIDGNVFTGCRLTFRISLLVKVIFFDGCVFHCPCASVDFVVLKKGNSSK